MVKFLHCADLHLDAPFSLVDVKEAERRRASLLSAFSSMLLYADAQHIPLVLIAGDLFDDAYVTKATAQTVIREMAHYSAIRFFITPGNHDYLHDRSPYRLFDFPQNVHIFQNDYIEGVAVEELGVRVYGYAYTQKTHESPPLAGFTATHDGLTNILLAHTELSVLGSADAPITTTELAASGFAYAALGHIHAATVPQKAGETVYAYAGCLMGRSFDECGIKSAYVGSIQNGDVSLSRVRFAPMHYERITVNVTGLTSADAVIAAIKQKSAALDADTILRLTLEGGIDASLVPDKTSLMSLWGVDSIELKDDTHPMPDDAAFMLDKSITGAFYRRLKPLLQSEDKNKRDTAYKALRYGLAALQGNDLTLF